VKREEYRANFRLLLGQYNAHSIQSLSTAKRKSFFGTLHASVNLTMPHFRTWSNITHLHVRLLCRAIDKHSGIVSLAYGKHKSQLVINIKEQLTKSNFGYYEQVFEKWSNDCSFAVEKTCFIISIEHSIKVTFYTDKRNAITVESLL
jgi:hypothetical protein